MKADTYLEEFVRTITSDDDGRMKAPSSIRASLRGNVLESTQTPKQLVQKKA